MKAKHDFARDPKQQPEKRFSFALPAVLHLDGECWECRLANLSRRAARIDRVQTVLPVDCAIDIAIDGWPRLSGRVLRQSEETVAVAFAAPLRMDVFVRLLLRSIGEDRFGDEVII